MSKNGSFRSKYGQVHPEPFSFDKRDEELKRRKEEKIKETIEYERKQASLFKAQPLPVAVKKVIQKVDKNSHSSASSENKENKFVARPATVLHKEPFKPVLTHTYTVNSPFELKSQKRAAQRAKFNKMLKEKEEQQEKIRLQKQKEQKAMEEKAMVDWRANLVHHPKPVPNAQPFMPQPSNVALTIPETT